MARGPAPDWSSASDSREGHFWTRRTKSGTVELWTTRRTPLETDQSAWQKAMVRSITSDVAALCCRPGERLHGIFVSDEATSVQPDAENIAFYNFGTAPFAGCGPVILFERSYRSAPEAPRLLEGPARHYHRWSVVPAEASFEHWIEGDVVASA